MRGLLTGVRAPLDRKTSHQPATAGLDLARLRLILTAIRAADDTPAADKARIAAILDESAGVASLQDLSASRLRAMDSLVRRHAGIGLIDRSQTDSPAATVVKIRRAFFIMIGLLCIYVLLSALLAGQSSVAYFAAHPSIAVAAVMALMTILFLLEGTQISIASLRLKDIDLLPEVSGTVKALHARYRSEEAVRQYLAGRQLFTIVTVFCISRICSFPEVTVIPGTGWRIPDTIAPWFTVIFFDFGILAALVTLWLAQLAPQFWANKQPVRFLSLPLAKATVLVSHAFESIGITDMGYTLTSSLKPDPPIPTSMREQYHSFAVSHGYATTAMTVSWRLTEQAMTGRLREDFTFVRSGIGVLPVTEEIQGQGEGKTTEFVLLRDGQTLPCEVETGADLSAGGNRVTRYLVRPRHARFQAGDVVVKTLEFTVDATATQSHRLFLSRPVRYLFIDLEVDQSVSIGQPRLQLTDERHVSPGQDFVALRSLRKVNEDRDRVIFGYFDAFPNADLSYTFLWGKEDQ